MPYPTQIFQEELRLQLAAVYPHPIPIKKEWSSLTGNENKGLYSPRIDVAVGPFSIVQGESLGDQYDDLMDKSRNFIECLIHYHRENVLNYQIYYDQIGEAPVFLDFEQLKYVNFNSRCLLAIEIENKVNRKHLLGGGINACVLGRLGIAVGFSKEMVTAFVKLQAYWYFLERAKKLHISSYNLLILSPDQLLDCIKHSSH